jgi:hypothetical protein
MVGKIKILAFIFALLTLAAACASTTGTNSQMYGQRSRAYSAVLPEPSR